MKIRRLSGFDLVIGLTLPVIIYMTLHLGAGQNKDVFRRDQFHLFFDGATALFLFVNGLTTGLAARVNPAQGGLQRYLLLKGALFIVLGLISGFTRTPDIFILLGITSVIAAGLLPLTSGLIRIVNAGIFTIALYFYFLTDIRFELFPPAGLSNPVEFVKHHSIFGYYAAIPWSAFFFSGLLQARSMAERKPGTTGSELVLGIVLIAIAAVVEVFLQWRIPNLAGPGSAPYHSITLFHLLYPSFMLGAFGLCYIASHLAQKVNEMPGKRKFELLNVLAKMKYSVLLATVVVGYLTSFIIRQGENFGMRTIVLLTATVVVITSVFGYLWSKRFSNGPVEYILRAFSPKN